MTECFVYRTGDVLLSADVLRNEKNSYGVFLEESLVLNIPLGIALKAYHNSPQVRRIVCYYITEGLKMHSFIKSIIAKYDVAHRWLSLEKHYPELSEKIEKRYLAQYLGTCASSLSRARKKIRDNGMTTEDVD